MRSIVRSTMKYNTAVIGGGPAGMIAAGFSAENNKKVVLIEKNERAGKKLLITGKGRCNITNAEENVRSFIEKFGKKGKFLYSALTAFGVQDIISFFEKRGLELKVERGMRVFPKSDSSRDVLQVLLDFLKQNNVEVLLHSKVKKIEKKDNKITKIILSNAQEIIADNYILATGGLSYPTTGSSGDGYVWLKELGHTIINPKPARVSILVKEPWIKELQGLSLKNVNISIFQGKKRDERFGEALFTDEGLSGPIILDMSRNIDDLLRDGPVELFIDFKPALDHNKLDLRILRDFKENSNKRFKNSLDALLPQKLIPVIINLSQIGPEKLVNTITKEERRKIINLLKEFKLNVNSIDGFERAVITSGGVDLKEIDPKSMKSKLVDNLYIIGELLDLDGPTGGFNLQVCWSTGYLAGIHNR